MLLTGLAQQFAADQARGRIDAALRRWADRNDDFREFDSAEAIVRLFRDQTAPYEPKSVLTTALCALSREHDETAKLLLLELYAPMLQGILNEFRGSRLEPDDLEAEIVAGFLESAARITPRINRPAGRLRWDTRDRVVAAIKRAWAAAPEIPVGDVSDLAALRGEVSVDPAVRFDTVSGATDQAEVLVKARDAEILTHAEAQVIALSRLGGRSLTEAAKELDLKQKPATLQVARGRAEARLEAWVQGREIPSRRKVRKGV